MARVSDQAAILAIGGLTLAGVAGTLVLLTLDRLPKRLTRLPAITSFVRFGSLVRFLLLQFERRGVLLGSALLIHLVTALSCYVLARGVGAQLTLLDRARTHASLISGWLARVLIVTLGLALIPVVGWIMALLMYWPVQGILLGQLGRQKDGRQPGIKGR